MDRRLAIVTAASLLALPGVAAAQSGLDRVVGPGPRNEIIQAHVPFRSDGVLMLLPRLARATGVPMGFEVVKGGDLVSDASAVPDAMEIETSHPLTGLPLRAALDLLVSLDRRYEWREMRGMVVVRPVEAWADASHVLHRMASIDTAELSLESALSYGTSLIDPPRAPSPLPPRSNRRFPLRLRVTVPGTRFPAWSTIWRLAVRGESRPLHRDGRDARVARRDDREYREYLREE